MYTFSDYLKDMDVSDRETMVPVQVIVWSGQSKQFNNLREAREEFPSLDPFKSSKEFTPAMSGTMDYRKEPVMRFEDWEAYNTLSL